MARKTSPTGHFSIALRLSLAKGVQEKGCSMEAGLEQQMHCDGCIALEAKAHVQIWLTWPILKCNAG